MNLYQITLLDAAGTPLHNKPMWLALSGQRRHELGAKEVFEYYRLRYDIEHFFRFGKDKLLMAAYQTPETKHEEVWWNLVSASYVQLYWARDAVPLLPKKWERYLPCYQYSEKPATTLATPSQTQRAFSLVLEQVGTPAKPCIARGKPKGRKRGETQTPRKTHPIVFKTKNTLKSNENCSNSACEKQGKNSDQKTIEKLAKSVQTQLEKLGCGIDEFHQLLSKSS